MLFLFTHYYSYQFILNTMMGYTFIKLSRSTRFLYPTICSRLICYGLFFFSVRVFRPFSHFIAYVLGYFFPHSYILPVLPLHCLCFGLFFSAFIYFARSPTSLLMFWAIFFRIHIFCPFFHVSSSFIFKIGEFLHLTSK